MSLPAYAVAHLRRVDVGLEIVAYLERIDATLAPFGGRFLIHGARPEPLEGDFPGHLVVVAFPDRAQARAWYDSPAYQAILPLRTAHSDGVAFLIDGVPDGHRAPDALAGRATGTEGACARMSAALIPRSPFGASERSAARLAH